MIERIVIILHAGVFMRACLKTRMNYPAICLHATSKKTCSLHEHSDERFSRLKTIMGDVGLKRLADAHVVVLGLGGVGSS